VTLRRPLIRRSPDVVVDREAYGSFSCADETMRGT
jgi:hypothetical protein